MRPLFLLPLLTACGADPRPHLQGAEDWFGECVGECRYLLSVDKGGVTLSIRDWDGTIHRENDGDLTAEGRRTLSELEAALDLTDLPAEHGCPDCDDGGGTRLRFKQDGEPQVFAYEFGRPPDALADLDAWTRAIHTALRTCEPTPDIDPAVDCKPPSSTHP